MAATTWHTDKVYLFNVHTIQGTNCGIIASLFIDTPLKILIRESEQSQWCGWHHCWPQHQLLSLWHYPHSLLKISETNSITAWKSRVNQWYFLWVSCRCLQLAGGLCMAMQLCDIISVCKRRAGTRAYTQQSQTDMHTTDTYMPDVILKNCLFISIGA